jgi:hypothetical protein
MIQITIKYLGHDDILERGEGLISGARASLSITGYPGAPLSWTAAIFLVSTQNLLGFVSDWAKCYWLMSVVKAAQPKED